MAEPNAVCQVETGLLRKKPCGQAAVTACLNCEQPLCSRHAVAEVTGTGRKTGKFLCQECAAAHKEYAKNMGTVAAHTPEDKKQAAPEAAKNPPPVNKPAAPSPSAGAAPTAPAAAPEPKASEEPVPDTIEFTPRTPPPKKDG